jgi:hypothetical protein
MATNPSGVFGAALALVLALGTGDAMAQKAGRWAGVGAGIGGIVGLVSGDLGDAVVGAAVGAAAGGVAGSISDNNDQKRAVAETQRRQAEAQAYAEAQASAEAEATQAEEAEIVAAIGGDNYESYKALRGCQHKRAGALAQAGAASDNTEHQLASVWLEALIALDQQDAAAAEAKYQELVERDPDIDTVQQASIEADRVLLDMRRERGELGPSACGT